MGVGNSRETLYLLLLPPREVNEKRRRLRLLLVKTTSSWLDFFFFFSFLALPLTDCHQQHRRRIPVPGKGFPFIILIIFPPITAKYLTSQTFGQLVTTFLTGRELNSLLFFPKLSTQPKAFTDEWYIVSAWRRPPSLQPSLLVHTMQHTTPFIYGPRRRSTLFLRAFGKKKKSEMNRNRSASSCWA